MSMGIQLYWLRKRKSFCLILPLLSRKETVWETNCNSTDLVFISHHPRRPFQTRCDKINAETSVRNEWFLSKFPTVSFQVFPSRKLQEIRVSPAVLAFRMGTTNPALVATSTSVAPMESSMTTGLALQIWFGMTIWRDVNTPQQLVTVPKTTSAKVAQLVPVFLTAKVYRMATINRALAATST